MISHLFVSVFFLEISNIGPMRQAEKALAISHGVKRLNKLCFSFQFPVGDVLAADSYLHILHFPVISAVHSGKT
jgi:hypothetical protein